MHVARRDAQHIRHGGLQTIEEFGESEVRERGGSANQHDGPAAYLPGEPSPAGGEYTGIGN